MKYGSDRLCVSCSQDPGGLTVTGDVGVCLGPMASGRKDGWGPKEIGVCRRPGRVGMLSRACQQSNPPDLQSHSRIS